MLDAVFPIVTNRFGLHEVSGARALHQAVFGGHSETVQLLLKKGADPNIRDRIGATPLRYAVWTEQARIVELLLSSGADPQIQEHSIAGQVGLGTLPSMAQLRHSTSP